MKLLAPFVLLVLTRRYLSFVSGAFDVIKFSNYYVKGEKGFFEDTLKWGILKQMAPSLLLRRGDG